MLATLGLAARAAVAIGLLLASAWIAVQLLEFIIRRRGSVWRLRLPQQRARRVAATRLHALLIGAICGVVMGLIGAWLINVNIWVGIAFTMVVSIWANWRVAEGFRQIVAMGETLLGGRAPEEWPDLSLWPPAPPVSEGRRIVILCDGTGNRPPDANDPAATNVWKIRQALVHDETQTVWYDAGVATGTSGPAQRAASLERLAGRLWLAPLSAVLGIAGQVQTAWEGITGTGIGDNILEAYAEIARQYRPGDRIYIIGFSRGAYTARATAGAIRACGLLKPSNLRYAPALLSLYRARHKLDRSRKGGTIIPIDPEFAWPHVPIEMLGLFDTVASLGAPLWGWWFNPRGVRNRALNTNPVRNCLHIYHALAMDERRATFFPTLFWKPPGNDGWTRTLEQVWFRGAHADIGGGYLETGLSDITLDWMLQRAAQHGLTVKQEALASLRPDPMARPHDETAGRPSWSWLGTWPRWAMVLPTPPTAGSRISVHPSVFQRARRVFEATGRHDLHDLEPGETVRFRAEARRQWDRTGLVLRGGPEDPEVHYRLRWTGGVWRDASCPPCGPAGNVEGERPGDPRWRGRKRRRVRKAPWMTLCATLAGPRRWPLRELPLKLAFAYLFRRDPRMLLNQVAPIGMSLRSPGDSVVIRSERPACLLYLFANDLWQTYLNNSGELELELTRLEGAPGGDEPLWTLPKDGPWRAVPSPEFVTVR